MDGGEFCDVGAADAFPEDDGTRVEVDGTPIALFRDADGAFAAFTDRCPHAGAPLSQGVLRDGVVVCSWHGWRFEPGTGRCPQAPWSKPAECREVRVEAGRVLVARAVQDD